MAGDLQGFVQLMFRHYVDPNSLFHLNGIGGMSDADRLLIALRNAKLFDAVLNDQDGRRISSPSVAGDRPVQE
jgi:hypothetical protein